MDASNHSSTTSQDAIGFLPYQEPSITTLLTLASFILLLNGVNALLDRLVYCGLVGQILIGVAWGAPGGNWLSIDAQRTIVQLGYLGLILLVYEGGLSTSLSSVKQNAWLSICVALVGIGLPIGLSFVLIPLMNASPLQAFAAGAALCSTSLGTTFTVLNTADLVTSRLGTVLATAAMMDDVVGLIMVQIVENLGQGHADGLDAGTIVRPIGVSVGLVLILVLLCRYLILPLASRLVPAIRMLLSIPSAAIVAQSLLLVAIFTGSSYAGTSGLFAAYLAGALLSWWDKSFQPGVIDFLHGGGRSAAAKTGTAVFESGYASVTSLLLKPLFFASIGFSVPISRMFGGSVVWRGVVYAIFMFLAKLATGCCLLAWSQSTEARQPGGKTSTRTGGPAENEVVSLSVRDSPHPSARMATTSNDRPDNGATAPKIADGPESTDTHNHSVYPAVLLGFAMTARGEIGYLIASVAESSGILAADEDGSAGSPIFLVVVWAVTLCTIFGPLAVGLLVHRLRRLERENGRSKGRMLALGAWGAEVD